MKLLILLLLVSCNQRVEVPINVLVELKDNPDYEACKNIYFPERISGTYCVYYREKK